jgi:AraC-like DNA-binding protein
VAFDLGFSSSQYFASAFKRFTNANPSELLGGKAES